MVRDYSLLKRDLVAVVAQFKQTFADLTVWKESRWFFHFNNNGTRSLRVHADKVSYREVPLLIVRKYDWNIEDRAVWEILDRILPHAEAKFIPQGAGFGIQSASHWEYEYSRRLTPDYG